MYEAKAASANKPGRFQFANSLLIKYIIALLNRMSRRQGRGNGQPEMMNEKEDLRRLIIDNYRLKQMLICRNKKKLLFLLITLPHGALADFLIIGYIII